jgi:N-acyl-D-amino-acid deacylase
LAENHIPSAALVVLHGGKLAYAQGYGLADQQRGSKATASTRYRIASCSKQFTAVTILTLHEAGMLDLQATVFGPEGILKQCIPLPGATMDPRLSQITITHLLQHTGGWNRDTTFDPMFMSSAIASAVGVPAPATPAAILRYMLGQPLQTDPGTEYQYSNFGYCVLGRVIETVTGNRQSYASYVRAATLRPLGITRVIQGHTRLSQAAAGEAFYYQSAGDPPLTPSVFPGDGLALAPYGAFYLEAMDSRGAWVASPLDLVRFLNAVSGRSGKPFLSQESIHLMTAKPAPPVRSSPEAWYGLGWQIAQSPAGQAWWHAGALDGTAAEVAIFDPAIDLQYAVVFNRLPSTQDWISPMTSALVNVKSWPLHTPLP